MSTGSRSTRRRAMRALPNGLSLFRLLSTPLVAILLLLDAHGLRVPAATLFIVASFTDYLDGYLARRWKVVSQLGVFMDLAADKILVSTVLIVLTGTGAVYSWMAAIIVGREFIISSLRSHAAAKGLVISASPLGKWKTAVTLVALGGTILEVHTALDLIALCAATALTLASAVDYIVRYWQAEMKS